MIEALKSILKQATAARLQGDSVAEADRLALEQAAIAEKAEEILARAKSLMTTARTRRDRGDRIGASIYYAEAITLLRANNTMPELADALRHAADVRSELKEYAVAASHIEEAVRLYRSLILNEEASPLDLADALRVAALNAERQAYASWSEACGIYDELHIKTGIDECAEHLANLKHHDEVSTTNLQEPAA